jgi:hypothetical protein
MPFCFTFMIVPESTAECTEPAVVRLASCPPTSSTSYTSSRSNSSCLDCSTCLSSGHSMIDRHVQLSSLLHHLINLGEIGSNFILRPSEAKHSLLHPVNKLRIHQRGGIQLSVRNQVARQLHGLLTRFLFNHTTNIGLSSALCNYCRIALSPSFWFCNRSQSRGPEPTHTDDLDDFVCKKGRKKASE